MRLALRLGMPLGEMRERMSGPERDLWMAFYGLEPWSVRAEQENADARAGLLASVTLNAQGAKKRGGRGFEPGDFIPQRYDRPPQRGGGRSVKEGVRALFRGLAQRKRNGSS